MIRTEWLSAVSSQLVLTGRRKAGYKWQERYAEEGREALRDRGRARASSSHQVLEEIMCKVLKARHHSVPFLRKME